LEAVEAAILVVAVAVAGVDTLTESLMLPLEIPTPLQLALLELLATLVQLVGLPPLEHLSLQQVAPEEPLRQVRLGVQGLVVTFKLLAVLRGPLQEVVVVELGVN